MRHFIIIVFCAFFFSQSGMAQIVGPVDPGPIVPITGGTTYTYDACGNRTSAFSRLFSFNSLEDETECSSETSPMMKVKRTDMSGILDLQTEDSLVGIVSLFDVEGRCLLSRKTEASMTMDLSSYPNGCYILQIEARGKKESWKILKQ